MRLPVQIRRAFTLIELLVTMALLATLATISISITTSVTNRFRTTAAIQQIKMIELAIQSYRMEYGHVPISSKPKDSEIPLATNKKRGKEFVQCIMGNSNRSYLNRRQIPYYQPRQASDGKNGWDEKLGLLDPWGNPYWILVDGNGDGILDVSVLPSTNSSWRRSEKSKGKNKGKDKNGSQPIEIRGDSAILSEGNGKSEPIASWSQ